MAAKRHFAEPANEVEETTLRPRRAPALAGPAAESRVSPAHLLQDELRRAFCPGPIASDQFSARRAFKFIAPTWLSMWAFVTLVVHIGHH